MLELLAALARRGDGEIWDTRARQLLHALSGHLAAMPIARLIAVIAAEYLTGGESQLQRHLQQGQVRLALRRVPDWHLTVELAEGLHIDGTTLTATGLRFAHALPKQLTGTNRLPVTPDASEINLTVQVCTDQMCHAPENIRFRLAT